ncbi:arylsulfatase I-like isoform X1 [Amphibalanus amphitrite]|uniref:arylsulfatase I-like isoform X1 n=1 Tax=Amphibalanus amphitrite TaxID=1232801 RepID=UPI001C92B4B5|nr:arylsulfatase I-like isoform X1 [Amphibalanus amphitrite]
MGWLGPAQLVLVIGLVLVPALCDGANTNQPHIVFILADDLGYNDVSWHNSDILSPTLEALAREGVILEQNYAQPLCTPSRSALLSGRYPFHVGRQHDVLSPHMPTGLTINVTLLPERLRSAGYSTHMVGKWHQGNCAPEYLPHHRGFDTFLGFWCGQLEHYNHTVQDALDFWDGDRPLPELDGVYATSVFTDRAESIIKEHNASRPLFMYLSAQNPHAPLEVPSEYEELYPATMNADRRTYSAMVTALDDSVGRVVQALKDADLYSNSVILFVSDNGGSVFSNHGSRDGFAGNNYPLRGDKNTLWEGGTRTPAFIHSPLLERAGYVSHELIHITDWMPTLLRLAGASADGDPLDGFDQWPMLSAGQPSARTEMVYNIDEKLPNAALRIGDMKLLWGDNSGSSDWYPVLEALPNSSDRAPASARRSVRSSLGSLGDYPVYLFNVTADPTERQDLSSLMPETVQAMLERLLELSKELVPADLPDPDPRGAPVDGVWTTGWCEPY